VLLFFCRLVPPPPLPSSPTRRSSDLLYFKALTSPPIEVLAHRVLWSALFLAGVLRAQGRLGALARALRSRRLVLASLASAALLRSEEHTSELQSRENLVCRLLLEKKK